MNKTHKAIIKVANSNDQCAADLICFARAFDTVGSRDVASELWDIAKELRKARDILNSAFSQDLDEEIRDGRERVGMMLQGAIGALKHKEEE